MPPQPPWPMTTICFTLQARDSEFERGRDAMKAAAFVIGRHQGGDVAHGEQFAGRGIEDHCGIGAAVGAGDDHGRRFLPVAQAAEEITRLAIAIGRGSGDSRQSDPERRRQSRSSWRVAIESLGRRQTLLVIGSLTSRRGVI